MKTVFFRLKCWFVANFFPPEIKSNGSDLAKWYQGNGYFRFGKGALLMPHRDIRSLPLAEVSKLPENVVSRFGQIPGRVVFEPTVSATKSKRPLVMVTCHFKDQGKDKYIVEFENRIVIYDKWVVEHNFRRWSL